MAHTRLFEDLINVLSLAKSNDQEVEENRMSRRSFLAKTAVTGTALMLPSFVWNTAVSATKSSIAPRIVIIGAGLAGLTCGYRLKQAGYDTQIFEASNRLGGRCWTLRGHFDQGQIIERGGELIDQEHKQIRQLAQELGLKLDNVVQAEPNGSNILSYINGSPYTFKQASSDIKGIWKQIHGDLVAAGYPTTYKSYTKRGWELDHMSILDWIKNYVPGGEDSNLGKLLDIAYNIEYGAESSEQSALNLIYLLGFIGQGQMRLFGPSNEKYHIRGGNDQIVSLLAQKLESQIQLNSELTSIKLTADNTYLLTFKKGSGYTDVIADHVVIAIPFSKLRNVDYSKANFNAVKQIAIQELQMGTNTKFQVQFTNRYWQQFNCNGTTISDTGYQNTWEVTRSQSGDYGILVNYTGGNIGAEKSNWVNPINAANQFLNQLEPLMPGISNTMNKNVIPTIDYWPGNPYTLGAYSYWKVGQYTKFAGVEGEAEGNCYFAGEHTSIDFQGYLNGAVESGQRAAQEILQDIKIAKK